MGGGGGGGGGGGRGGGGQKIATAATILIVILRHAADGELLTTIALRGCALWKSAIIIDITVKYPESIYQAVCAYQNNAHSPQPCCDSSVLKH